MLTVHYIGGPLDGQTARQTQCLSRFSVPVVSREYPSGKVDYIKMWSGCGHVVYLCDEDIQQWDKEQKEDLTLPSSVRNHPNRWAAAAQHEVVWVAGKRCMRKHAVIDIGDCTRCGQGSRTTYDGICYDCLPIGKPPAEEVTGIALPNGSVKWNKQYMHDPVQQASCPDCKGSKVYMGLQVVEPCRSCR